MSVEPSSSVPGRPQRRKPITGREFFLQMMKERTKGALYFHVSEEPRVVRLERSKIHESDFRPFLDPDDQTEGASARIECVRVTIASEVDPVFQLYYFEQTRRNGFDLNDSVTRELQGYADGLRRPWYGPILVIWDEDDVVTEANVGETADQILGYLNNFYEDVKRDDSIEYDKVEEEE
ncbi:hypothetical protein VNI00_018121 [Paramarasmius palmivorus]|uniref:Uncharacterized protein n=1 Tax=Paramarasmius palmivorus TaxID=297713 RepID=A0AAW0B1W9_9AGAR